MIKVKDKPISTYSRQELLAILYSKATLNKTKNKIRNYLNL